MFENAHGYSNLRDVYPVHRVVGPVVERWPTPNCIIHCVCTAVWLAPKANETEMGVAIFTQNDEGRNSHFDFLVCAVTT